MKKEIKEKKVKAKSVVKVKAQSKKPAGKRIKIKESVEKPIEKILALHNIKVPKGAHKMRKLLGRGPSSGHGKTSTRGSKGQTSRAGRHFYLGFEGGQSPLIRKFPKRGFVSNFKKVYQIVNLEDLNKIKDEVISPEVLKANGLISNSIKLIKILGNGSIKKAVVVQAHVFSKRAVGEIVSAGGKAEIIPVV